MKKCFLFLTTIALILSLSTNAFAKILQVIYHKNKHCNGVISKRAFLEHNERPQSKSEKAVCPSGTFEYQNLQYVYMCSDLGTKAKAVNYLTPIFTKTAIEKGFKDYHFTVSKEN